MIESMDESVFSFKIKAICLTLFRGLFQVEK